MNPTDHERRRAEYEQTFLDELRDQLLDPDNWASQLESERPRVRVEDVRLDISKEEPTIVILFRDLDRPECLFGYSVDSLEYSGDLKEEFNERYTLKDAGELYATIAEINWEEDIYAGRYGLPAVCSPEGVNWIPFRKA